MATRPGMTPDSMSVDVDNLYREETYTDLHAASIRQLTPVKSDGSRDPDRPLQFIGDTTLMTQMGPLPLQFAIEAESLEQAFEGFPQGVREAVERLNERAKEMAREEASRIVVPSKMPGGGLPGGGLVGTGKLG
ncbi:MAG: hypothetical protein HY749_08475 [Gammaproteobacteria bacterium]|nr:hypothetical protein [Gammaproteobacteria bacterium]MBI5615218.1 hypothetical protein [Gammaproteobacteria bacterium]